MKNNAILGLFGGTFDPIHRGHLQPLSEAARQIGIEQIKLIPCHIPPHKASPNVAAHQRLQMVKIATANTALFSVDDRELKQQRPSYSVHTLTALRHEYPQTPLCFFMGMDSLRTFASWYKYQDILALCHLVIMQRPGHSMIFNPRITQLLATHQTQDSDDLQRHLAGKIFISDARQVAISATELRQRLARSHDVSEFIDANVLEYIQAYKLYR